MRGSHPTDSPRNNHLPRLKVPRRVGWVTLSLLNKIDALSQSLDKDKKEGVKFEEDGQEGDSGGPNIKTEIEMLYRRKNSKHCCHICVSPLNLSMLISQISEVKISNPISCV